MNDEDRLDGQGAMPHHSLQGVKAVLGTQRSGTGAREALIASLEPARGSGRCNDLIVFFHSYCSDHVRAIGSPYNPNFPNPGNYHNLSLI